jgi:hypothetical protein
VLGLVSQACTAITVLAAFLCMHGLGLHSSWIESGKLLFACARLA